MNDKENQIPVNITPITPQPIEPQVEAVNNNQQILKDNNQNTKETNEQTNTINSNNILTPNLIIPEIKEDKSNNNINNEINNSLPQLNLESSSPFDIGVNSPVNTNQVNQEPITINNNINTTNDIDIKNNKSIPDINIEEPIINNQNISVGTYLLNMLLFSIPIIGLIVIIIRISDKKNKNISNLAKAYFILEIITTIIALILPIIIKNIAH